MWLFFLFNRNPLDIMLSPEEGQMPPSQGGTFIEIYKSQIITGLAALQAVFGLITAISIFSPLCIPAGILQIIAAICVLAIEAPTFVAMIRFAQPISLIFEDRPMWMKAAFYVVLAIIPCLFQCFGVFFLLAFITSLSIAGIYGFIIIGQKGGQFSSVDTPGAGPYSPTSP